MNTPRYGNTISTIIQIALATPDVSCRRNKSLITVISNQNHITNTKIAKTSSRKLPKLKLPAVNMLSSLSRLSKLVEVGPSGSHLTEDSHLRFCTVWFCATLGNAQRNIHSGDAG